MADHFCPSCGTEVEADARFCPSCGTTLALEDGLAPGADAQLPPAPAWPTDDAAAVPEPPAAEEPTPTAAPATESADQLWAQTAAEPENADVAPSEASAPSPASPPPASPPPPATAAAPAAQTVAPVTRSSDIPLTWPTTVAGWLIGAGSLLGAIFLIATLGNVVSLLLFVPLLGIAASVFVADHMPEIPRLRLLVLVTTMIGLGVALARAGFTVAGVDTLFLLAMLAAGGGALLIEFDRDRPWPPPERSGG
ncbi:MAG TPA: zinc-ribbon domain-containing protein [Candidatus Limnocylindria bacterium]|nr:zinc-ribbon domain-containing protein [Candidatus Limnocylindria bacterium]